jgi:hypothetical protein
MIIEDPFEAVSDAELDLFEAELGAPLPRPYREFLQANNGGFPASNFAIWTNGSDRLFVQYFFPLSSSATESLQQNLTSFPINLSHRRLLPIAVEGGGSYFLLNLDDGSVVLWDRDPESPEAEFRQLSSDFSAFLNACGE